MKISEIFNLAIEVGIEADFRGKEGVKKFLKRKKEAYEKLSEREKEEFDKEGFENPYLDSRVYHTVQDNEQLGGLEIKSFHIK